MRNPHWLTVRNDSSEPSAVISITGPIGESFWDETRASEKQFRAQLDAIPMGRKITIHINSQGGSVQDGLGIYDAIKGRRDDITARITGYALSIASVIPLAAGKVITPKASVWMLHKPWSWQEGNADDMRKAAEMLDANERALIAAYADKTGKSEDEISKALEAETWLDGSQAQAWGLADETSDDPVALSALNQSGFRNCPAALCGATPPEPKGNKMEPNKQHPEAGTGTNPDVVAIKAELEKVRAQLEKERKDRIERELDQCVAEDRITVAQRTEWLPKCIADESLVKMVKALEPKPKTTPVGNNKVENHGTVADEYSRLRAGAERFKFRRERFSDIVAARRGSPQAGNTISGDLLPDTIADALIVALSTRLAAFNAFSRDFGVAAMSPLSVVQVRKATSGSTLQTNPTNWESGNSVIDAIPVTVAQKAKSFHLTNAELNSGHRISDLTEVNANEFAVSLSELATAVMLVADYGTGTVIGTAANFDSSDLPAILALAKNYRRKNLILDGGHLARLQALNTEALDWRTSGAFGFDTIAMQNKWTGATANTAGFVCDPDAIAVATGLPLTAPAAGGDISQSVVTLPDNGLSVQVNTWFSRATRTTWVSYDIMIGVAKGDTDKGEILLTV